MCVCRSLYVVDDVLEVVVETQVVVLVVMELVVVDDEYLLVGVVLDELAQRMEVGGDLFAVNVVEDLLTRDLLHVVLLGDVLLGADAEGGLGRAADEYFVEAGRAVARVLVKRMVGL